MIHYYKTQNDKLEEINDIEKDCWIRVHCPTPEEIELLTQRLQLPTYVFQDPLDIDEGSRIEINEDFMLVIYRVPYQNTEEDQIPFLTIPLGIVLTDNWVLTICSQSSQVLIDFVENKIKNFSTFNKNKFILQIFLNTASAYLKYLKEINRRSSLIEKQLQKSMENKELIKLLNLEKSLVYFTTSLKSNEIMIEKIQRNRTFRTLSEEDNLIQDALASLAMRNPALMERLQKNQIFIINSEEENLLEDVLIENKQAIEMTNIYSNILTGMMGAFASVISNNLTIVMKSLTLITIILMIPNLIASIYGTNLEHTPYDSRLFTWIMAVSIILPILLMILLRKKRWF